MKRKILFIFVFILFCGVVFSQKTTSITGLPNPTLDVGQDLYLTGLSVQPTVLSNDPGPGQTYIYNWIGPNGFTSTLKSPQLTTVGTYICTVTSPSGCSAVDQLNLFASLWTQNPLASICQGDSVLLDLYLPNPGDGYLSGTGVSNRIFHGNTPGTFTITWTASDSSSSSTNTVTVLQNPDVRVSRDTYFNCLGNSVNIQAIGYANTYQWSLLNNPTVLSTQQNYSVTVDSTTHYLLVAGLTYTGPNKTCYVRDTTVVKPIASSFTYVQDTGTAQYGQIYGSNIHFIPDYESAYSYQWNFGNNYVTGGGTSTQVSPTYNYAPYLGYFTVSLKMVSFCGTTTSTKVVRVNYLVTTGVDDIEKEEVVLYPNPAVDYIYMQFGDTQVSQIQVFDMTARLVSSLKIDSNFYQLNVSNFKSGTYIVKIIDKQGGTATAKFIKQ